MIFCISNVMYNIEHQQSERRLQYYLYINKYHICQPLAARIDTPSTLRGKNLICACSVTNVRTSLDQARAKSC